MTNIVEIIARGVADGLIAEGTFVSDDLRRCQVDGGMFDMHDVVRATLTALEAAGYAVVPKEPTEAMIEAAHNVLAGIGTVEHVYRAMINAGKGEG